MSLPEYLFFLTFALGGIGMVAGLAGNLHERSIRASAEERPDVA